MPARGHGWSKAACGVTTQQWSGLVTPAGTSQVPTLLAKPLGCHLKMEVRVGQLPALGSALAPHTNPAVVSPAAGVAGHGAVASSRGSPLLVTVT